MFIRLNVEANSELRVDDIQSIEYELIDPNQKRVTTFSPDKPIDVVEIEPDYLKLDGTYAVVGKLKYLLKNDIIETTITMPFDVLLQVKN